MGTIRLQDLDVGSLESTQDKVENYSSELFKVVQSIVEPYSKDLDKYVKFIRECLNDGENPPTNEELDDFCMNLSTLIYFAGSMCEQIGIKDDISKAIYKEVYHSSRSSGSGTVADKDSFAELESQREQLVNMCYNRAYKIMKAKVENAQELLGSCKKVLSRRMSEFELTRLQR